MSPEQPSPTKAKSRLSKPKEPEEKSVSLTTAPKPLPTRSAQPSLHTGSFIRARLKFIPLLIFAAVGYFGCFYILKNIDPESIANIAFFHSYLPLQISFLIGNFFVLNFFLLHTRRAFLVSCALSAVLFLRLQSVTLTSFVILIPLVFFLTLESIFSFIFRK